VVVVVYPLLDPSASIAAFLVFSGFFFLVMTWFGHFQPPPYLGMLRTRFVLAC
jgi:hypothetical protein